MRAGLALLALVLALLPASAGASSAQGLYLVLGDSNAAGFGASTSAKSFARLYFAYLRGSGSGVSTIVNLAQNGATTTTILQFQLRAAIDAVRAPSDTKVVTITVGGNDLSSASCYRPAQPPCRVGPNLRALLSVLKTVLRADPGVEVVKLTTEYNPFFEDPGFHDRVDRALLGTDGKLDCSGTGDAVGLNDLTYCIAIANGAVPVDIYPVMQIGGRSYLADGIHPNDEGHAAIAKALIETTAAPPGASGDTVAVGPVTALPKDLLAPKCKKGQKPTKKRPCRR